MGSNFVSFITKNLAKQVDEIFVGAEDEISAYCYAIRRRRGTAARPLAKNMPQAYFLNARAHLGSNLVSFITKNLAKQVDETFVGAEDEIRTRDPHLGKVMLYP